MKNNIKKIRFDQKLTQAELAKRARINRVTLVLIEKGENTPDGLTIAKLVEALNVPANKIFPDFDVVCGGQSCGKQQ